MLGMNIFFKKIQRWVFSIHFRRSNVHTRKKVYHAMDERTITTLICRHGVIWAQKMNGNALRRNSIQWNQTLHICFKQHFFSLISSTKCAWTSHTRSLENTILIQLHKDGQGTSNHKSKIALISIINSSSNMIHNP